MSRAPFLLPPMLEQGRPPEQEAWLDGYLHHFSASGLRLLKVCPRAWQERYIKGKKERPGEALVLGSAFHDALAFNHEQKIDTHEDKPVKEVVEFYNDAAWPRAIEDDGGEDEIRWDNTPESVRKDGERVTSAYHSIVSPRIQPIAVEQRFEIVVPGIALPFLGYIDIEEDADVIDTKTGKQVSKKPDANWRMQGVLYSMAKGKPTHFHSISRAKTPSIATPLEHEEMVVTMRESQRALVEQILRDFAAQVEFFFNRYGPDDPWPTTGLFNDYKGGRACDFCGFRGDCPAWAHERVIVTDMTDIQGNPITL
jgi:hypothetical protein